MDCLGFVLFIVKFFLALLAGGYGIFGMLLFFFNYEN